MLKLTKKMIENATCEDGKERVLWDSEVKGFGVRLKPTGTKTFVLQYRNHENRTRKLTLGRFPAISVDAARKWATENLVEVYKGRDPQQEKQAKRTGLTIEAMCEWYLREARAGHLLGRMRRPIKDSTLNMDESRIRRHILPLIGNRIVSGLRRSDIEKMQTSIISGKTSKPRKGRGGHTTGGPGVASRAVGTLHSICEHAIRYDLIEKNPAKGVRRHASNKSQRRLSRDEITEFGLELDKAAQRNEHPVALAAIRFALLTGFRRMEVLGLQYSWVDRDSCLVRFPDTKSGAQVRVIGQAALDLIEEQRLYSDSRFVFQAAIGGGHFVGVPRVLQRIIQTADLNGVTMHVLRHTFASVAGDLGYSELTIRALLGHSSRGVTQRYVHVDDPLRTAVDRTCEHLACLLSGRPLPTRANHQHTRATFHTNQNSTEFDRVRH